MSTISTLKKYEADLRQWKERGGLTGQGGTFDRKTKTYQPAAEPTLQSSDEFAKKLALQIRMKVLAEPNTKL
jgi:hypothetical protein